MDKKVLIIFLLIIVIGISGCTINPTANSTFGEKNISLNAMEILNNTTSDYYEYEGINYYYLEGYIQNNNEYDVFNVKINVTAFDKNGKIIAVNDSAYFEPKNIPANGISYFYVDFNDTAKKIAKYDINIISAKATP